MCSHTFSEYLQKEMKTSLEEFGIETRRGVMIISCAYFDVLSMPVQGHFTFLA